MEPCKPLWLFPPHESFLQHLHKQFSQVSFLKWALYFNHNGGINNNLGRKYSQIQIYFLSSVCIGAYLHNISTSISRQITDWMIFYVFSYLFMFSVVCSVCSVQIIPIRFSWGSYQRSDLILSILLTRHYYSLFTYLAAGLAGHNQTQLDIHC